MDVGAVTRSFPELSNQETASFLRENQFRWTELCFSQTDSNYWVYNGRSDLCELTDERSRKIVDTYRNQQIEVASVGVFTNLLEPSERELEKNLAYFERLMEIASINQIPVVASECGFIPGERGIRADQYEEDFQRLVAAFQWLAKKAEHYQVDVALEPCVLDVVPSAKRTVDFIHQVGSNRVKVLLDPANLIANNTEQEMFDYLADHIAYFHGKDRKVNDARGRIVGDGDIDWSYFLDLYWKHTPEVPFILEYVNRDNVCEVRDRVVKASSN